MGYLIRRSDKNQDMIVQALRKAGALVYVTSKLGSGYPDLTISAHGRLWLVEIKSSKKSKLTVAEQKFHETWKQHVVIITSVDEAIDFVNKLNKDVDIEMLPRDANSRT